jgi:hypothetical protein
MTHTASLHWGRIIGGGLLGELLLILMVIPLYAAASSDTVITWAAVLGSFVVFVPVAWWLTRLLPRRIRHGALMGAAAAAIYTLIGLASQFLVADAPAVPLIYYVGHALKLAGGATGGWLAQRSPSTPVSVS